LKNLFDRNSENLVCPNCRGDVNPNFQFSWKIRAVKALKDVRAKSLQRTVTSVVFAVFLVTSWSTGRIVYSKLNSLGCSTLVAASGSIVAGRLASKVVGVILQAVVSFCLRSEGPAEVDELDITDENELLGEEVDEDEARLIAESVLAELAEAEEAGELTEEGNALRAMMLASLSVYDAVDAAEDGDEDVAAAEVANFQVAVERLNAIRERSLEQAVV
jgi:hypothetical protein